MGRFKIALLGDDTDEQSSVDTDAVVGDEQAETPSDDTGTGSETDIPPEDKPRPDIEELSVNKVLKESKELQTEDEVNKAKEEPNA